MHPCKESPPPSPAAEPGSITLNSRIRIEDLDTGEVFDFRLVSAQATDNGDEKLLITTPLGAALVGREVGSVIHWKAPSRLRRFRVNAVA